ncbi:MAG: pseudouridine synthase [Ginsengibacter sp.]
MTNQDDISLNKYISETGYCSRRAADGLIAEGRVLVNGKIPRSGNRVSSEDEILVDGKKLKEKDKPVYLAFNKPVGITCTTDLKDRSSIIHFIKFDKRIFPIGRLDKPSEGLIFLTNDGDIVNKILRAGNKHEKEYIVTVDKPVSDGFIQRMGAGLNISGAITQKCFVKRESKFVFRIILTQGLNRQIRRMCAVVGYDVVRLVRTRIMNITLGDLKPGKWRFLNNSEINHIHHLVKSSVKTEEASKI